MAADRTIYTSHWLSSDDANLTSHIIDLIAKVIQLESNTHILDRKRIVYEKEWQAVDSQTHTYVGSCTTVRSSVQFAPVLELSQAGRPLEQFSMPRSMGSGIMTLGAVGLAVATSTALTTFLQSVASQLSRGSMLQLKTLAAQVANFAPQGGLINSDASAAALGMQSMMRVAVQELPMMQWAGMDLDHAHPVYWMPHNLACRSTVAGQTALQRDPKLARDNGVVKVSDIYGRSLLSNVWHAPLLLVHEPRTVQVSLEGKHLSLL